MLTSKLKNEADVRQELSHLLESTQYIYDRGFSAIQAAEITTNRNYGFDLSEDDIRKVINLLETYMDEYMEYLYDLMGAEKVEDYRKVARALLRELEYQYRIAYSYDDEYLDLM